MKLKSNEPFWLIKNGLLHTYPSCHENLTCDILIVGGGITGSLIAHQCIEEGFDTILIDKREIANGSTSATTSMLQYEIDVPLYKLNQKIGDEAAVASYKGCFEAIDTLGNIAQNIASTSGFEKKDSLYFAAYKKDVAWLKEEFHTRKKYGFPVEWLDEKELKKQYGLHSTFGGILSHQGASVDGFQLTHDILAFNHKRGLRVYDKTALESVQNHTKGITAETEFGNTIKARHIIYCTGYESTELIPEKFVDLISTYAIISEVHTTSQDMLQDVLIWNTADPYLYLRTTDDHRILIGGEDVNFVNAKKRDQMLRRKTKILEQKIQKILPQYIFRTDFSWAGTFGVTKDGLPYIGEHKGFPHAYFVLGFGGNGITFSVMGMEMVSGFLKGETHPLSPYFGFFR